MISRFLLPLLSTLVFSTKAFSQTDFAAWNDFIEQAKKDLTSDSIMTQIGAIEGFRKEDHAKSATMLISLIKKDRIDYAVLRKAAETLSSFKDEGAAQVLADEVHEKPDGNHFLLYAYLLRGTDDRKTIALAALQGTRDPSIQRVAIEGLKYEDSLDIADITELLKYLDEKNYHAVRKACATVLGHKKFSPSIPILISYLNDKVIADKVRDALLRLTGEEHWRDSNAWKTWWADNEATYKPDPMDELEFLKAHERLMEDKGDNAMRVEFYEREITGKNIVFILDRSGSMHKDAAESGLPRIDRLKTELTDLVDRLDEDYTVGFVMFPHEVFPRGGIEPLKKSFRKKAVEFIETQKPNGGTPMREALEYAYTEIVENENVDTIYLLSDGAPSDASNDEIRQLMLGYTDRYGVTVNSISIGRESKLLKEIAEISGGQYWESQ